MPLTEANVKMANQHHEGSSNDGEDSNSSQNETGSIVNGHCNQSDVVSNASTTQRRHKAKHKRKKVSTEDAKTKNGKQVRSSK